MLRITSSRSYRFTHLSSAEFGQAVQQHIRETGSPPAAAQVNPKNVAAATSWLRGLGLAETVELRPNGGTLANEVWLATAAKGETPL